MVRDEMWRTDTMIQAEGYGGFVRALLPVHLTGGYTVTYGLWLGVHPDDLQRAFAEWEAPTYADLVLDAVLANSIKLWGLLATPARAVVRDPNQTPYVDSSPDELLCRVLRDEWPHDVLPTLPGRPRREEVPLPRCPSWSIRRYPHHRQPRPPPGATLRQ